MSVRHNRETSIEDTHSVAMFISKGVSIHGSEGCKHCLQIYKQAKTEYLSEKAPTFDAEQRVIFFEQDEDASSEGELMPSEEQGMTDNPERLPNDRIQEP